LDYNEDTIIDPKISPRNREVDMELHLRAKAQFIVNQETDLIQPQKMTVKKIRVSPSKRFMEDTNRDNSEGSNGVQSI